MAGNRAQEWQRQFMLEPPQLVDGVHLKVGIGSDRMLLQLRHEAAAADFEAVFLTVPYPSGLRRILARYPGIDAVVVEEIPSGFDAAALEAGISYMDKRGFGRMIQPGFVYFALPPSRISKLRMGGDISEAQGRKPDKSVRLGAPGRTSHVSPFAPKASRVPRALLADPLARWRLSELAASVDVDPGNAHRILHSLIELDLVERDEDRYIVPDPGSLLEAWAEASRRPRETFVLRISGSLEEVVGRLLDFGAERFVFSGEFAAESMAPYLDANQIFLHCLDSVALSHVRELGDDLPYSALPSGRIEAVLSDSHVGDFGSVSGEVPFVSPAQLYVDLFRERGRAREAAEQIRHLVLNF